MLGGKGFSFSTALVTLLSIISVAVFLHFTLLDSSSSKDLNVEVRVSPPPDPRIRIAFITIAQKIRYYRYANNLKNSLDQHFCPDSRRLLFEHKFILFSDYFLLHATSAPPLPLEFGNSNCSGFDRWNAVDTLDLKTSTLLCGNAAVVPIARMGWPDITLDRFRIILEHWQELDLDSFDFIYWMDADTQAVNEFCEDILGILVGTRHVHLFQFISEYPVESRTESTAYINVEAERPNNFYYTAHLYGGRKRNFRHLVETCANATLTDRNNNIVARVHDESHLNHYLVHHQPTVILNIAYTCAKGSDVTNEYTRRQQCSMIAVYNDKAPLPDDY